MNIIPTIIEQHVEEASFNWFLRDNAVTEPDYNLVDLAYLDDRIEANIDGLRIAGEAGWDICLEAMDSGDPGEIFTAGVLAFESRIPKRMDSMLAAVEGDVALQRALCSALGWINFRQVATSVNKILEADLAFLKCIGLSVYAIHRQDIGAGLGIYISHANHKVRSRALKAAGELGRIDLLHKIRDRFSDKDEKCRFYAAWSAVLLGSNAGIDPLKRVLETQSVYEQSACEMAVRKMDNGEAVQWLNKLGRQSSTIRLAINGYGALGDPQAIPRLIEMMQTPELARPAGEAFSMITGVDITYMDLDADAPEDFHAGPTEDPEDEDVDMDPDEDLPWPDPELISAWWHNNKQSFQSGRRYLAGNVISSENCMHVLINGFQRQRMAGALELALLHPGRPLFEVRAPGYRQQRLLQPGGEIVE
ncbi:TIGR02270 family protein [Desulfobacter sp.]